MFYIQFRALRIITVKSLQCFTALGRTETTYEKFLKEIYFLSASLLE